MDVHVTIKDMDDSGETTACVDRRTNTARLIVWHQSTIEIVCRVLQSMGVDRIEAAILEGDNREDYLLTHGFGSKRVYLSRQLSGQSGTARSTETMPND